jgi:two-component system chemotaxis response regulator CheY
MLLEKLNVLLIDDNNLAITMMQKILNKVGVGQIYTASDGKAANKFLAEKAASIDVILCDWEMPNMNGLELLQEVRQFYPNLHFIMVTGHREIQLMQNAADCDVDAFLCKPFSPHQLQVKLQKVGTRKWSNGNTRKTG